MLMLLDRYAALILWLVALLSDELGRCAPNQSRFILEGDSALPCALCHSIRSSLQIRLPFVGRRHDERLLYTAISKL